MTKTLIISIPRQIVEALDRCAQEEGRSRSEVLRAAALAYLEWKKDWRSLQAYGKAQAKRLGLRQRDVDRLIQDVRKGRTARS